jgi:ABC-type transport system involved in multi-copper enzyme maturation permease subunit
MKRRWANLGLPLLSKELAEMAQLRRTYLARVGFALLMFSMSALLFLPTYQALSKLPKGVFGHGAKFFDVLFAIEWAGLVLFVPAVVSGALTAEKERNTLQLLFLTKLAPWTILLEKLLSRLVPVATFLLVSLPLLFIAYLWGGLTQSDVGLAMAELALVVFELAAIALFCSAFCATSASAFILSYVITALVFLCPFLIVLTLLFFNCWSRLVGAGDLTLVALANAPAHRDTVLTFLTSTLGINLAWLFDQRFGPGVVRPFHTVRLPFVIIPIVGVVFLLLARRAIVSRAVPQPKHRIRRLFAWLDRLFTRLNDRYAKGILLASPDSGIPEGNPVAWREKRRGNLGRVNYLIRVLVVLESPILVVSVISAGFGRELEFTTLGTIGLVLWPIGLLIVLVRAAGLVAAEKARQTLDVLLTTPLSASELIGAKMRGLRRTMAIVAVPIIFQTLLIVFLRLAVGQLQPYSGREDSRQILATGGEAMLFLFVIGLNLVILFKLAAELAFFFGLYAKTQARAVTYAVSVFAAMSFLPVIFRIGIREIWAGDVLYLSPIADILVSEFPWLGVQWRHPSTNWLEIRTAEWQFYPLLHCAFYAVIVWVLMRVNRRLAAGVLLRPKREPASSRLARRMPQMADPTAAQ